VEFGRCPSGRRARRPSLKTAFAQENTGDVSKLFPLMLTTLGQAIPRRYQDLKLHNVPPHNGKVSNILLSFFSSPTTTSKKFQLLSPAHQVSSVQCSGTHDGSCELDTSAQG